MVVSDKKRVRAEFAEALKRVVGALKGAPKGRGMPAWVYRRLRDKDGVRLVSQEQVRKWLNGTDLPDQANLRLICERLPADITELQPALAAARGPNGLLDMRLRRAWEALGSEDLRREVVEFAEFKVARAPPEAGADNKRQRNGT